MTKLCDTCNTAKTNEEREEEMAMVTIPMAAYQADQQRNERREKRYIWLIVILIALIVVTNAGWLIYESQFETYSYAQDGEGTNIIGDSNQVDNYAEEEVTDGAEIEVQEKEKGQG